MVTSELRHDKKSAHLSPHSHRVKSSVLTWTGVSEAACGTEFHDAVHERPATFPAFKAFFSPVWRGRNQGLLHCTNQCPRRRRIRNGHGDLSLHPDTLPSPRKWHFFPVIARRAPMKFDSGARVTHIGLLLSGNAFPPICRFLLSVAEACFNLEREEGRDGSHLSDGVAVLL